MSPSELPIELSGPLPEQDGKDNTYHVSRYEIFFHPAAAPPGGRPGPRTVRRNARTGTYPVIFVNGQQGNPHKHRAQACAVSAVSGGPVTGVYNASAAVPKLGETTMSIRDKLISFFGDTAQSIGDKFTSQRGLAKLAEGSSAGGDQLVARVLSQHLRKHNPATATLFDLLTKPTAADARIVAHSQGNLITANALNALTVLRGTDAIRRMRVYAIASPTFFWGDAKPIVRTYNFSNDGIGWLSGNFQLDGWAFRSGSGPRGAIARGGLVRGDSATLSNPLTETISGYARSFNQLNRLTHSFYIYLGELWDELSGEFPTATPRTMP